MPSPHRRRCAGRRRATWASCAPRRTPAAGPASCATRLRRPSLPWPRAPPPTASAPCSGCERAPVTALRMVPPIKHQRIRRATHAPLREGAAVERLSRLAAILTVGILVALGLGVAPAAADTVNVALTSRPAAAGDILYLTAVVSPSPIGGEVRFDSDQGLIDTAPVFFGKAEIWFVPRVSGTITVTATYTSFDGGTKGTSAPLVDHGRRGAIGSVTLGLTTDTLLTVGKQAPLTATVTPPRASGGSRSASTVPGWRPSTSHAARPPPPGSQRPLGSTPCRLATRARASTMPWRAGVVVMAQGGPGTRRRTSSSSTRPESSRPGRRARRSPSPTGRDDSWWPRRHPVRR